MIVFFLYYGAVLLIPVPSQDEAKMIEEELKKQKMESKRQDQFAEDSTDSDEDKAKKSSFTCSSFP